MNELLENAVIEVLVEQLEKVKPVVIIFPETSTTLLPDQCFDCGKHPEGFCTMYKGKENRQHSRVGGCAGRTHDREIVIDKNGKEGPVNPLKASKRKQAGIK